MDKKKVQDYEGIWESKPYKIGIKKEGSQYIGFIIESGLETWTKGQVKLKFSVSENEAMSVFYLRDHAAVKSGTVSMTGKNHLHIGRFTLTRLYPRIDDEPRYVQYFSAMNADRPFLEQLDESTVYFRIPSFDEGYKGMIDSLLSVNRKKILAAKNFIIDIRNNGGGSDASYQEILPYLYTNPIRIVGTEYFSTKLNNRRMLELINNPEFASDEEVKTWAKAAYDTLERRLGQFVNLNDEVVTESTADTIYPYPRQVGILINEVNGSTAEQFILEARQSLKVKLFGVTTAGVLDISNMYFVDSPCKEFQLGYSLSRSMRIPEFTIDEKGIQPDYFLDRNIPPYEWIDYVNKIFNGK